MNMNTNVPSPETLASLTTEQRADIYQRCVFAVLAFQRDAITAAGLVHGREVYDVMHDVLEETKLLVNSIINARVEAFNDNHA